MSNREQMNIVIAGHVDHGKSTVIGRLLADTGSLPEGKLEQVKATCARNARPFEYAFLLDALKDEQSQGITIDIARCFFKTAKRDYILIDAPGHIEFLKNMVTGASRSDAALLVIDAHEGVRENSRRHGFLLSMLGLKQVIVLVNKMDLVGYDMAVFERIKKEYTAFLAPLQVKPIDFIPICARDGENIAERASWHTGKTVLEYLDELVIPPSRSKETLRFPVQDIYKFTEMDDERRIVAGTIESGTVSVGDKVVFYPSRKSASIKSIEAFNRPCLTSAVAGNAFGVTLTEELYIKPGELLCRADQVPPMVSQRFRGMVFWMMHIPLVKDRRYKLKIGATRVAVELVEIRTMIDATGTSDTGSKQQLDRHDVAECIFETIKPVAFDTALSNPSTGRFVIVANYEIAGCGIVLESLKNDHSVLDEHVKRREVVWEGGGVGVADRYERFGHQAKFILLTGSNAQLCRNIGHALEANLFANKYLAYYLGYSFFEKGLSAGSNNSESNKDEDLISLGELARVLTGSGHIFITARAHLDGGDIALLERLNQPHEILVVTAGDFDAASLVSHVALNANVSVLDAVNQIYEVLKHKEIIPDFSI